MFLGLRSILEDPWAFQMNYYILIPSTGHWMHIWIEPHFFGFFSHLTINWAISLSNTILQQALFQEHKITDTTSRRGRSGPSTYI